MDPQIDTLCQIDIRDLFILGVKKVVSWLFPKFLGFGKYLALFFQIYSFWRVWGVIFDNFGGQKSRFLDLVEVF